MKIFLATLGTESNTFATYPASTTDFRDGLWSMGNIASIAPSPWSGPAQLWRRKALERGWQVVESLHTYAQPAGTISQAVYEELRDVILSDVQRCGQVDAVLLHLHGAMVAQGYDDCEADLVKRLRAVVGPHTAIGVELDLHAHLDQALLDAADLIVMFKAYPHTDYNARAQDLFNLTVRLLAGEIRPEMCLFECRTMGLFPTTPDGPMKALLAEIVARERRDGILSLSLNHGFPWADVPIAGAKMLTIADGDRGLAETVAREFGHRFYDIRKQAALRFTSMDEAIAIAAEPATKPVVLADVSDQTGGGAPGDTCHMVRAFMDTGISSAAFGPLWDPGAIAVCFQLGVGAKSRLRIGGKFEPLSGPPLDIDAEILFLQRDAVQDNDGLDSVPIGDVAVIRSNGIDIVLTSLRTNVYSPAFFTGNGVTLPDKQVIGVKNLYKHTDSFAEIARGQYYVATPGLCQPDFAQLNYRRLPRPIWPFDDDPLERDHPPTNIR